MIYIRENIITELQKLYSPPSHSRVGYKSPVLLIKNLVAQAIYCPLTKYSLIDLKWMNPCKLIYSECKFNANML